MSRIAPSRKPAGRADLPAPAPIGTAASAPACLAINPVPPEHLLSAADLGARWQKSLRTLQRWRVSGSGPAWIRIGRSVHYRLDDIRAFEDRMRHNDGGR